MITKSVKRGLLALLAISLFAGSAVAAMDPTPIELSTGTVTIAVSFDAEASSAVAAKATDTKKYEAYAPAFTKLTAFTTGITPTLENLKKAAEAFGGITAGNAAEDNALTSLAQTLGTAAGSGTYAAGSAQETLARASLTLYRALGVASDSDVEKPTAAGITAARGKLGTPDAAKLKAAAEALATVKFGKDADKDGANDALAAYSKFFLGLAGFTSSATDFGQWLYGAEAALAELEATTKGTLTVTFTPTDGKFKSLLRIVQQMLTR